MTSRTFTRKNKMMPVGDLVDETVAEIKRRAREHKRKKVEG